MQDEPWSHVHTFTSGPLTGPEPQSASSYDRQERPACWSSSHVHTDTISSSCTSYPPHSSYQDSLLHRNLPQESRIAALTDSSHEHSPAPETFLSLPPPMDAQHQYDRMFERDCFDPTVPKFQSVHPDEQPVEEKLTTATSAPRAIPGPRRARGPSGMDPRPEDVYSADTLRLGAHNDPIFDSSNVTESQIIKTLTSKSIPWRQQHYDSSESERVLESDGRSNDSSCQFIDNVSQGRDPQTFQRHTTDISIESIDSGYTPEFSKSTSFPDSRAQHQSFQSSSSLPTAQSLPICSTSASTHDHDTDPVSISLPKSLASDHTSLPMRRKSSKTKRTERSRSGSLRSIQEEQNRLLGSSPRGRGRRHGQLSQATAEAAAVKRSVGNVCIRCRMMKQTVSSSSNPRILFM